MSRLLVALLLVLFGLALCAKDKKPRKKNSVKRRLEQHRVEKARLQIDRLAQSTLAYAVTRMELPPDLKSLVERKYIKRSDVTDPWGEPIHYEAGSSGEFDDFELCSKGSDGNSGTEDDVCYDPDAE